MATARALVSRLMEGLGVVEADGRVPRAMLGRPLRATRFVSIDLETTGLDRRRDAIVSVAAVEIDGLAPVEPPALNALVAPGRGIPAAATAIHGITDSMVAGAPPIDRLLPAIVELCAGAVVVGHHVAFDIAMLRGAARAAGHSMPPLAWLDTWRMAGALDPRLAHRDMADIARRLGVDPDAFRRHEALDDARLAARLFVRLADRYAELGHATLGAVEAMSRRWRPAG
ncbi:MAG: 3'-5' exonuclease [Rhodospirillales bacterium]|nr:3'-5' exonuclease [Rhodospirillales bacterium]